MFLDILFPNRCIACNSIILSKEVVCPLCMDKISFTNWKWNSNNALKERTKLLFQIENAYALMNFEKQGLSQELIHQLKYQNREKIGEFLAKLTVEKLDFGDYKPDLLVSVPLHPKKEKERGYNQLHFFTETLSKYYQIPFSHDVLQRKSNQTAQAKKDKSSREKTENPFQIKQLPNQNIQHLLIIDDVFTTGNTMSNVVWEILSHQNYTISVLVMAID